MFSWLVLPSLKRVFFHTMRGREGSLQFGIPVKCFALSVQNASHPLESTMTALRSSSVQPQLDSSVQAVPSVLQRAAGKADVVCDCANTTSGLGLLNKYLANK